MPNLMTPDWTLLLALALALMLPPAARAAPSEMQQEVEQAVQAVLPLYRWFHQHPELSGQERATAQRLATELRALGLQVTEGVGGTGIVAVLRGKAAGKGPVVLYRADMDALPVREETGLAYASQTPGVMHACGHDLHMSAAVGTLRLLAQSADAWAGTVLFVGQPAEETGEGALAMLKDRTFQKVLREVGNPKVAFALHDAADLPAGVVGIKGGFITANVDSIDIELHGRGGHGARPHETVDPVVMAAELVMALQTIVSRRIAPGEKAVITVGKIEAGSTHNIIPSSAKLLLTVRSYGDKARAALLAQIERMARGISEAHGATQPPTIAIQDPYTPAGENDQAWSTRLEERFAEVLGAAAVRSYPAITVGEDFARFGRELNIPSVMWWVGAAPAAAARAKVATSAPGLHAGRWAPDAPGALHAAIVSASTAIREALRP